MQKVEVEFNEGTDLSALALALEGLGMTEVAVAGKTVEFAEGRFEAGRFTFLAGSAIERDVLARGYTKATLLSQSERFGWATKAAATAQKALAGFTRRW